MTFRIHKQLLALLATLVCVGSAASQAIVRGPYLQRGTDSEIVVCWRTDVATDSAVAFGAAPGNLNSAVTDGTPTTEHVVTVTGLAGNTTYYYSVGTTTAALAGGDADHFFVTSPPAGSARPTRIWVLGDSGTADASAQAVRDAYYAFAGGDHTDLWLMLGDNAYSDGTDSEFQAAIFEDMYESMLVKSVLWPTLGNHDAHTAVSATESGPYYDIFELPRGGEAGGVASGTESYYSFDFGNIHFVCLDSADGDLDPGSAMETWLAADTAATLADWIIAFWHHPPYTKGSHDSDAESALTSMREVFVPLLEDAGVDLVLSGHSHSYERSMLIDGHYGDSSTFAPVHQLDAGDGDPAGDGGYVKQTLGYGPHEGAVYAVAGSSGKVSNAPLDHPVMVTSLADLGSLVLDVDGSRLDARFVDDAGAVRDSFRIDKGQGGVNPPVADFAGQPTSGPAALSVDFQDASTGAVTSWSWDFGDGGASNAQDPTHVYTAQGSYSVSLTVSGAGGDDTEIKNGYITVEEPAAPPVAAFSGAPLAGTAPVTVDFTDESSGLVTNWSWDFGDGASSSEPDPSHLYSVPGSYSVSLTVTGPGGEDSLTQDAYVTVDEDLTPGPTALTAIALGDRAEGVLGAGDEAVHMFSFPAVAGTVVSFTSLSADGIVEPNLRLFDPGSNELVDEVESSVSPKKARIKKVTLAQTGVYMLWVSDGGQQGGSYKLRTMARFPGKQIEVVAVGPSSPSVEASFGALQDTLLKKLVVRRLPAKGPYATVEGQPSRLDVSLASLAAPVSGILDITANSKASINGKQFTVSKLALPDFGTYTVTIEGQDDTVGWAKVIARVKMTKGKVTHTVP